MRFKLLSVITILALCPLSSLAEPSSYKTFDAAEVAFQNRDFQTAITQYRLFLQENPASNSAPLAMLHLGDALSSQKKPETALECFRSLQEKYPTSEYVPEASLHAGGCLYDLGKKDEAIKQCLSLLKKSPDNQPQDTAYEQVFSLFAEKGIPFSEILRQISKIDSPQLRYRFGTAYQSKATQNGTNFFLLDQAAQCYKSILIVYPKDLIIAQTLEGLVETYLSMDEPTKAEHVCTRLCSSYLPSPYALRGLINLGKYYGSHDQLERGLAKLHQAARLYRNSDDASNIQLEIATLYANNYHQHSNGPSLIVRALWDKADGELKKVHDLYPSDLKRGAWAELKRINLSYCRATQNELSWKQVDDQIDKAITTYQNIDPKILAEFYHCLIDTAIASGDWEKGIARSETVLKLFPNCGSPHIALEAHRKAAICYTQLNQPEAALPHILATVIGDASCGDWSHFLDYLIRNKHYDLARKLIDSIITNHPGTTDSDIAKSLLETIPSSGSVK